MSKEWKGYHEINGNKYDLTFDEFTMEFWKVKGKGKDTNGSFHIEGTYQGFDVEFDKKYNMAGAGVIKYKGTVSFD
jgi:hypothetical protein